MRPTRARVIVIALVAAVVLIAGLVAVRVRHTSSAPTAEEPGRALAAATQQAETTNRELFGETAPGANPLPTPTAVPPTPRPGCAGGVWWFDAPAQVGRKVTIEGPLTVPGASTTGNTTLLLQLGQQYPDPNTILVQAPPVDAPTLAGWKALGDAQVCVTGNLTTSDGQLVLTLASPGDITRPN